jgi:hypothetical protein
VFTPHKYDFWNQTVKQICIGSVYIAPRSQQKSETIENIIQVIHYVRSIYDNQVNFTITGDFNRTDHSDILESFGALHKCVTVGTRQTSVDGSSLSLILSDLHTHYHPPTTLSPLQVDENKNRVDADHKIIIFATKAKPNHQVKKKKKTYLTPNCRPLGGTFKANHGFKSLANKILMKKQ